MPHYRIGIVSQLNFKPGTNVVKWTPEFAWADQTKDIHVYWLADDTTDIKYADLLAENVSEIGGGLHVVVTKPEGWSWVVVSWWHDGERMHGEKDAD